MKYKSRRRIAVVAVLTVVAVANQKTNGVHCFILSKSAFTPRFQTLASNTKNMNTRQRRLHYRINGDGNQTDHETSSTTRNTNTDFIVENLNHPNTLNIIKEDEIENETETANMSDKRDYVGAGTSGDIMSDPSQDNGNNDAVIREDRDYISLANSTTAVDVSTTNGQEKVIIKSYSNREQKLEAKPESNSDTKTKPTKSGLVTSTGGTLSSQFGQKVPNLSPLDRIALTANGNLQRIFSSFYDAPVHVHVDQCVKRATSGDPSTLVMNGGVSEDAVWDRVVHLSVFEQNFCKATSVITVYSKNCVKIVESGEVGIGQLFRYLDKLPTFTIVDAGRCENGGLWRRYILECDELTCEILEEFVPNAWQLQPNGIDYFNGIDNIF